MMLIIWFLYGFHMVLHGFYMGFYMNLYGFVVLRFWVQPLQTPFLSPKPSHFFLVGLPHLPSSHEQILLTDDLRSSPSPLVLPGGYKTTSFSYTYIYIINIMGYFSRGCIMGKQIIYIYNEDISWGCLYHLFHGDIAFWAWENPWDSGVIFGWSTGMVEPYERTEAFGEWHAKQQIPKHYRTITFKVQYFVVFFRNFGKPLSSYTGHAQQHLCSLRTPSVVDTWRLESEVISGSLFTFLHYVWAQSWKHTTFYISFQ